MFVVFNIMRFIVLLFLIKSFVDSQEHVDYGLPDNFEPNKYDLVVNTYLEEPFRFEGLVKINITCKKPTYTIVLNSVDLDIDTKSITIFDSYQKPVSVNNVNFDTNSEKMNIQSTVEFQAGIYTVSIPFKKNFTNIPVGYYMYSFSDKSVEETTSMAITKFFPTGARYSFPCFDNIKMKAKFNITLGHHEKLISISNMQLLGTKRMPNNPKYVLDEYEESPLMSTFSVVYMVSEFQNVENICCDTHVKVNTYTRNQEIINMNYMKAMGPEVFTYYEQYFNTKYPLEQLQLIVLPSSDIEVIDYINSQTWGAIIFSEDQLEYNPLLSLLKTVNKKLQIFSIVCNALIYQWFGVLVSMDSWDSSWLYYTFSTFMGYVAFETLYPDQKYHELILTLDLIDTLDFDSYLSSHKITAKINNPQEIFNQTDSITTYKSITLFRMLNITLGKNTFQKGLANHIGKYKFSTASDNDLWTSLTDQAHQDGTLDQTITVKDIMDSWTDRPGYPILKVQRDYSNGKVVLSQERYLVDNTEDMIDTNVWIIPLSWTTSTELNFTNTNPKEWYRGKIIPYDLKSKINEEWIMFNIQYSTPIRILYDTQNWLKIANTLNDPKKYKNIHLMNRIQLVVDSIFLSQSGHMDYNVTFLILNYLQLELEFVPVGAALYTIGSLYNLLRRTSHIDIFRNFVLCIMSSALNTFGDMNKNFKDDMDILEQEMILSFSCFYGHKKCIQKSKKLFAQWMTSKNPEIIPLHFSYVSSTIYRAAIIHGGKKEWNFLLDQYNKTNDLNEKNNMLSGLASSTDCTLLKKLLQWSIQDKPIIHSLITLFNSMANSDHFNSITGFNIAKNFLYNNIADIYKQDPYNVDIYIEIIGIQLNTDAELKEFQDFISKSSTYFDSSLWSIQHTISKIRSNIKWTKNNLPVIQNYMICNKIH